MEILTSQCFVSFLSFATTYNIVNPCTVIKPVKKIVLKGEKMEEKLIFLSRHIFYNMLTLHLGKSDSAKKHAP